MISAGFKTACGNSQYYFERISPESGFAFDAVYAVSEDCNGFIWFGCNNGLYYNNTVEIKKVNLLKSDHNVSQSLRITDVLHDDNCRLWVCADEGLFRRNQTDNTFDKIVLYSKDSIYNSNKFLKRIVQFDKDKYIVMIQFDVFYFDINDGVLNEIKINWPGNTTISNVELDDRGNIFIGTIDGKIFTSTHPNKTFELFYNSDQNKPFRTICDDNNKYYIGFDGAGVDVVNSVGDRLYMINSEQKGSFFLPNDRVRKIIKTDEGEIWVGTYQGIVVLKESENTVITNNRYNGLPNKSIYALHKGKNGGIWIGTWAGGIAYYHKNIYRFNHIAKVPDENEIRSVISSFVEDDNDLIWVGSEQSGVSIYNTDKPGFINVHTDVLNRIPKRVKSMIKINNDKIYIGTFLKGIWSYDLRDNTIQRISKNTILDRSIISTMAGNEKELWVGPRGLRHSLLRYDLESKEISSFNLPSRFREMTWVLVWHLMYDSSFRLWVCTDEGVFFKNKNDKDFQKCSLSDSVYDLNETMIYTIYEDHDEMLWIGTKGKGVFIYNPVDKSLSHLDSSRDVIDVDVFGITEDDDNNIWFSTDNGIFQYHRNKGVISRYTEEDGLPGNQFAPNSIFKSSDNELFFGSSNGFSYINPKTISHNSIEPNVYLTKLLINNVPLRKVNNINANSFILDKMTDVKLKHHQNSLTFGVTTNNFIKPHKNKFKYRLVNYNDDWIEVNNGQNIAYTKIPPGNYTLEVMGTNNDGLWSKTPLKLSIEINYPLWMRWYSLLFYIVVIQVIAYFAVKEALTRFKLKKQFIAERYKNDAQEHIYEEKNKFFTNISHELRTPLTLVISPLENLIKKFKYDDNTLQQLMTIKRNSSRLLRLTNQILDYRLLEVKKLKANLKQSDIIEICNEVIQCFDIQVREKQVNLIFSSEFKKLLIPVDKDMIDKVIYNLISNALKFSNEKGQVFLSVESKEGDIDESDKYIRVGKRVSGKRVEIKVRDYGKGIKKDLLPNIFERFSTDPNHGITGTGIGLHMCNEYASLHDGNIMYRSEEGQGAIFILNIPFNENAEYKEKPVIKQVSFENQAASLLSKPEMSVGNKSVVLLTEDNDELRIYLKNYLQYYYKVVTAKNGQQAFEIAKEVIPDVIISDILMPQTDGIELTNMLKNDKEVSHIPIIILTALSEIKYQKESLLKGVESYLTKPVDETLLLAQIENILSKKKMMEKHFSEKTETVNNISNVGMPLIEQAEKIVEENLQNTNFDLSALLELLNVSRSTFHRKIKKETNQSPSEFIRDIRLRYAVKLMKTGSYNIDEIGAYVGFNSTSYFIRTFKNKYGKTPKEYYNQLQINR